MRVESLSVQLRPRPMNEAADLGVRMVQSHAASIWGTCLPVFLAVFLIALSTVEIASWLPMFIVFWLKPWLDRSVLFVLSRAVFGEETRFADLWVARRQVWWQQWPRTLVLRRLSPWRSFTQPIYQLEGQSGAALKERRAQLMRGQGGAATFMHLVFAHMEMVLYMGVLFLVVWMLPEGVQWNPARWLAQTDQVAPAAVAFLIYAAVVAVLEPFYMAAGFAMYLNRRVELEAWDIEQEFRRVFDA
jgi:hypothetical protein